MTLRHAIYTALAGLHLALVACGAARWEVLPPESDAGHGLRLVRTYSGSDASFSFFAPGVSSQLRAHFVLLDADGKEWTDTLDGAMSREAQLRVSSGVSLTGEFPGLMKLFGPSWAATMFGRHPTAKRVVVALEVYDLPTMEQYQEGRRPRWEPVFVEVFDRK